MALTILAQITAIPGQEDLVRTELENLIAPTRAEGGCLRYDLHVDNERPGFFVFYETWSSRELWQYHMQAAHIARFGEATQGMIETVVLYEMTRID